MYILSIVVFLLAGKQYFCSVYLGIGDFSHKIEHINSRGIRFMQCPICDAELSAEMAACPACGTLASSSASYIETSISYIDRSFAPPASLYESNQPPPFSIQPVVWQSPAMQQQEGVPSSRATWPGHKKLLYGGVIFLALLIVGSGFLLYAVQANHATASRIGTANPTSVPSTPTIIANPYPPYSGTLAINDALGDNSAGYGWMDDSVQSTAANQGCRFKDGAYHIVNNSMLQPYMVYCLALQSNFSDFAYQVQATLLRGDEIGVVFRQSPSYRYYYFYIRLDGSYGLLWNDGGNSRLLESGSSPAIHPGLHQPNILAVVAQGNTLNVYVNHQLLTSTIDTTYAVGRIGTAVASTNGSASDSAFNNLMLWTL
jgi:hypothetical protein